MHRTHLQSDGAVLLGVGIVAVQQLVTQNTFGGAGVLTDHGHVVRVQNNKTEPGVGTKTVVG